MKKIITAIVCVLFIQCANGQNQDLPDPYCLTGDPKMPPLQYADAYMFETLKRENQPLYLIFVEAAQLPNGASIDSTNMTLSQFKIDEIIATPDALQMGPNNYFLKLEGKKFLIVIADDVLGVIEEVDGFNYLVKNSKFKISAGRLFLPKKQFIKT